MNNGHGLTAVAGLKVGHCTLSERPTGCTVVLAEQGAVCGVDVRGASPGTLAAAARRRTGDSPVTMVCSGAIAGEGVVGVLAAAVIGALA